MSNVKATIQNVDEGQTFIVQFNPKEFKLDEKANWKASDEHQKDKPLLTYEKGEPSVLTVDLVFDTTDGGNVYTQFVKPLRALLTADVEKSDGQGNQIKRPPYLIFSWGNFSMNCVCEKLSTTFLMFNTSGQPIRAKVQLALKERDKPNHGASSSMGAGVVLSAGMLAAGGAGSAAYVAQPGDNLNRIASKTRSKPEHIALANNISDPMDIQAGRRLVIPANETVAQVLAQQSRRRQEGNWRTTAAGGPGPRARGGFFGSVPSAFDETPPTRQEYDVRPGGIADQFASFGPMAYDVRDDSEFAGGTGGKGVGLGVENRSAGAGEFRDTTDGDEGFARRAAQVYGNYGDSESALGTGGQGIGLGVDKDSSGAGEYRNLADGDEGFARAAGQSYGGYGDSESALGTGGQGIGLGVENNSSRAGEYRDLSDGDQGFARAAGQSYGGYGGSDSAVGTGGEGIGMGVDNQSSDAGAFRDGTDGDSGFARPTAQGYGGHGGSDGTLGTSGEGAALGGHRGGSDAGAFRDATDGDRGFARPDQQAYGQAPGSEAAGGTAGDGAALGAAAGGGAAQAGGGGAAQAGGGAAQAGGGGAAQLGGGGGGGGAGAGGGGVKDEAGDRGDFAAAFRAAKDAAERTKKGE
jgi:LysM repeat protein